MKFLNLLLVLLLVPTTSGILHAADSTSLARSAGKLVSDSSFELNDKLLSSPILQSGPSKDRASESTVESTTTQKYRLANHGVEFVIYDAKVELTGDIDNDGFYHNIKISFDADVNIPEVESVYAILYLSYEDGPWQQFADTDLFEIDYDSPSDTYVVMSELIEGYPPGYYDVLIELYSDYHEGIVASLILTRDIEDFPITLEDLGHDEVYDEVY
ncbi:MAG: choice-of-anchor H family protein, partial [Gammaproteobacteria bacterium]|nr:choice-of-anchor H family protein [Gammaproteobacteria bacterium]